MSEPPSKRPRVTPRNSNADETVPRETPYNNLRQLATRLQKPATPYARVPGTVLTPNARDASQTPGRAGRTPGTASRTPRSAFTRSVRARVGPPTTPHAIRALQQRQRNAAGTPGADRRRSGRQQRETPRDTLRNLSRILAKKTAPIQPSPLADPGPPRNPALDDFDEGPDIAVPRLSMPLDDDEDDSFHLRPPRLSMPLEELEDDQGNLTAQSMESGRRILLDDARRRLSRASLGRLSERFADLNELGLDLGEDESEGLPGRFAEASDLVLGDDLGPDDTTQDVRTLLDAASRRRSRPSDVNLEGESSDIEGGPLDNDTFQFRIPARFRDASPTELEQDLPNPEEDASAGELSESESSVSEAEGEAEAAANLRQSSVDRQLQSEMAAHGDAAVTRRRRRKLRLSKHGIEYPSLPQGVVKRLATNFARGQGAGGTARINKEALQEIVRASDWFFEQISEDLACYAGHARRKTIDESDVDVYMERVRLRNANTTKFSLAQKHLPRELLQYLRMPPPKLPVSKRKRKRMETIDEEDEDEV